MVSLNPSTASQICYKCTLSLDSVPLEQYEAKPPDDLLVNSDKIRTLQHILTQVFRRVCKFHKSATP